MKKQFLAVMGSALLLTACSNGGGGNNGGINPLAKPPNPAPEAYLQQLMTDFQASSSYLPAEEALFDIVMDGENVKSISANSPERKEALNKLNTTGRQFVDKILKSCEVKNANLSEGVGVGENKEGVSKTIKLLTMSTRGANCVYLLDKSAQFTTVVKDVVQDSRTGDVRAKMIFSNNHKQFQKIQDASLVQASKFKSLDVEFGMTMNIDYARTAAGETSTANGSITGKVSLELSNGDVIQGPITGTIQAANGQSMMRIQFSGSSPQGDIWIVAVSKGDSGEIYVNGEKRELPNTTKMFNLNLSGDGVF